MATAAGGLRTTVEHVLNHRIVIIRVQAVTPIRKYPRTPHVVGSRIQAGDDDVKAVPREDLAGLTLIVEEKLDGSNSGLSFGEDGALILQSRGT